jgi:hypothetical protein
MDLRTTIGLLPTPQARDGDTSSRSMSAKTAAKRFEQGKRNLDDAVALLPTPTANDWKGAGPLDRRPAGDDDLSTRIDRLLPTPRASDGEKGGPNQRGSSGDLMLPSVVMSLLPTPTATQYGNNQSPTSGSAVRPSLHTLAPTFEATTPPDKTMPLLPTPRVAASRTSRSAATRRDSLSGPSLDQALEIARGELPREFTTWEEMPASWHGASTPPPSDAGN